MVEEKEEALFGHSLQDQPEVLVAPEEVPLVMIQQVVLVLVLVQQIKAFLEEMREEITILEVVVVQVQQELAGHLCLTVVLENNLSQ